MVGGETETKVAGTAASFVVQADEGAFMVWDALGDMTIARTPADLGRVVLASLRDPRVPRVEAGPGLSKSVAALTEALMKVSGSDEDTDDRTAVHVVVVLGKGDGGDTVVWPPKGPPRVALDADVLGSRLDEIVADESQPRVPAGRPPDPGGELWDKGLQVAAKLLPGFFGAEG